MRRYTYKSFLKEPRLTSMATSGIECIEMKRIHDQWVAVKVLSSASCMNPVNVQDEIEPSDVPCKSIIEAILNEKESTWDQWSPPLF